MLRHHRRALVGDLAREAEVGDAQVAVLGHEQVGGLEVAVDDAVVVRKAEATQELEEEVLEVLRRRGGRRGGKVSRAAEPAALATPRTASPSGCGDWMMRCRSVSMSSMTT